MVAQTTSGAPAHLFSTLDNSSAMLDNYGMDNTKFDPLTYLMDAPDAPPFEITGRGTDRETLVAGGLRYWLDITSDPQNSIGWVVEDENGSQEMCSVVEATAIPGADSYVIDRTCAGIETATARARENDWSMAPVEALHTELTEAARRLELP